MSTVPPITTEHPRKVYIRITTKPVERVNADGSKFWTVLARISKQTAALYGLAEVQRFQMTVPMAKVDDVIEAMEMVAENDDRLAFECDALGVGKVAEATFERTTGPDKGKTVTELQANIWPEGEAEIVEMPGSFKLSAGLKAKLEARRQARLDAGGIV